MIEGTAFSASIQALLLVGVVLVEAVALYVGYGRVERATATPLFEIIERV